jgi:transcriptional regulator
MAQTTTDDATIKKALRLLRAGQATQAEVADLAGTSRQLVRYWCERAEINAKDARAARLARLWAAS